MPLPSLTWQPPLYLWFFLSVRLFFRVHVWVSEIIWYLSFSKEWQDVKQAWKSRHLRAKPWGRVRISTAVAVHTLFGASGGKAEGTWLDTPARGSLQTLRNLPFWNRCWARQREGNKLLFYRQEGAQHWSPPHNKREHTTMSRDSHCAHSEPVPHLCRTDTHLFRFPPQSFRLMERTLLGTLAQWKPLIPLIGSFLFLSLQMFSYRWKCSEVPFKTVTVYYVVHTDWEFIFICTNSLFAGDKEMAAKAVPQPAVGCWGVTQAAWLQSTCP